uniref:Transmembrane and coiled-coil domain-containing protein 4-like n=1 Tax=Ananas comosus var. bracteatus TaxID=296719 RepID=A0A6V7PZZ0_ANACO|nr:unnamed protein product [Ananas comosus var. bracteatus]
MAISCLNPTQRYAAGALLALALRQAQIHQSRPLGAAASAAADADEAPERFSSASSSSVATATSSSSDGDGDGDAAHLWTHESRGLLRPVFRFLGIDPKAWPGLEETAASSEAKHHVGAYLRIIFEEDDESSSARSDQELALTKAVDAMVMNLEISVGLDGIATEKHQGQEHEGGPRNCSNSVDSSSEMTVETAETSENTNPDGLSRKVDLSNQVDTLHSEKLILDDFPDNYQRKVVLLYELLSACVADTPQDKKESSRFRKGYDARHRVALRLLAAWLNVQWIKMEAIEIIVACSAMAAAKEEEQSQENESEKSKWARWKRGGIIGAAALTGGALLAITGGLAAPAIAAGFSALAPTLGTLVPVIGASGFAAMASAAGSVAGSVAVAASFGAAGAGLTGSKMARRMGSVKEFDFKPIGDNHNQGRLALGILISGFVFEEEDFLRPWEGWKDNLERYALQWESKNLIAVSTAIQDWLTSRLTMELMKRGAMMTVLSTLVTAFAWPATLLAATDFIDSKWSIAIDRADKAGKLLAECLQELAESGDNEGLVERVVLLGAPVSVKGEQWEPARKMVAGRFINVYSTNDWILGVTFRASLLTQGLAGIQSIEVPGVENVDVTDMVDGHSSYLWAVQQILEQLELNTYYPVFTRANTGSK